MYSNSNQDFCPLMPLSPFYQFPLLFSGMGWGVLQVRLHLDTQCKRFSLLFFFSISIFPPPHFSRRYKWHCNIISVENTSKCNPALHVCGDTLSGHKHKHTRTHTHTQLHAHTHTHVQSLWLVSICVYICACIC